MTTPYRVTDPQLDSAAEAPQIDPTQLTATSALTLAAGSRIEVAGLTKTFGKVRALDGVDLEVRPGEFLALLGPSGSGKTTLLMSLAGFEQPDSGSLLVDGRDITRVPPHKRQLGMMFQRYALFPNLNVAKNVEYPLKARGVKPSERARLVEGALRLVSLEGYGSRRVSELSGGQQQRVALARAIVFSPTLLLMDEPLGALDRKLREQVQLEIRALHRRLGATIVFVTHDQGEAMTMADRIAVMDNAKVSQVGTPRELYENPANRFVAGFLGTMNFLTGTLVHSTPGELVVDVMGSRLPVPRARVTGDTEIADLGAEVHIAIRPHATRVGAATAGGMKAVVREVVYEGPRTTVIVMVGDVEMTCEMATTDVPQLSVGDPVVVSWRPEDAHLFTH